MSKYTVYNVKGSDKNGAFDVYRRFNEFFTLKEVMVTRWPGCFIPSIPAKEMMVSERSLALAVECNELPCLLAPRTRLARR